ncbi:MAG: flavodoxin-dependent (E)-4-hydroxy-3-methylbut-2-enyl-diphosphate synthase [Elusimicrobiota bacterium]
MITREINIGSVKLGGENPVRIQGMLKSSLDNIGALVEEAGRMIKAGAEIIRCAIPDKKYAGPVHEALKRFSVPLVADCHFQSGIALEAVRAGFQKVRLNPGNMSKDGMKEAIELASEHEIALRFGYNTGSCDARTGEELAEAALKTDEWVREQGFSNFLISMKSPSVGHTVEANRFFSVYSDTPLHIGITATGLKDEGLIRSAAAIGALLIDGIGDTVRVSLTGDSIEEIKAACILRDMTSEKIKKLRLVSCPTCSRSRMDVVRQMDEFIEKLSEEDLKKPVKVAIMGCEVNGPGEAKECDIGVCGTEKGALFIKDGRIVSPVDAGNIAGFLIDELRKL